MSERDEQAEAAGLSEELAGLLAGAGVEDAIQAVSDIEWMGEDPILATRFRTGSAAAIALAGCGVLAARCWQLRGGARQDLRVDLEIAAASLTGFAHQRLESAKSEISRIRPNLTDFYATRDARWFLLHAGFPHLQAGALEVLGVAPEADDLKQQVAVAVLEREAFALEDAFAKRRVCGAVARSEAEWRVHPQGVALARVPVVEVVRVGESPPEAFESGGRRPLDGVRALDLTRVLAGPTCSRTLAEHGAEVLKITSPSLPSVPFFVMDTGHGKRSAYLDLKTAEGSDQLRALIRDADVFVQGYRGGAMERLGLGAAELLALRPGLIHVSINCYGHEGPWRERAGWEQLAQTVTGIADEHGAAGSADGTAQAPRLLPAAATDYTTGYLAALGTLAALTLRATEGGSYRVRVSLARTGMWLQGLGRTQRAGQGPSPERVASRLVVTETPFGRLTHLGPVAELSATPGHWQRPTVPLGTHAPSW